VLLEGIAPPNDEVRVYTHRVEPQAFDVLGISLLSGRGIQADDNLLDDPVVVVSSSLARRYYGDEDPIGRRILFNSNTWVRIVGVAEDVRYRDLTSDPMADDDPDVYLAYYEGLQPRNVGFVVRVSGETAPALSLIRRTAEASLAGIPVQSFAPLSDGVRNATALSRFGSILFATFGTLAGILAAVGIYGVIAVSVGQRRQEIAIRMALGAGEGSVLGMVMRQGGLLAAIGLGLGLLGALAASRSLGAFLFGIEPVDAPTYAVVTLLLGAVAVLATWLPARRATKVHPSSALRPH
jgi:ABC-type antimicrobial peptide transport system permease subunit